MMPEDTWRWARPSDEADLASTHSGLKVHQIMTHREKFVRCAADEPLAEIYDRVDNAFDFLPVFDGDQVIGLLDLRAAREKHRDGDAKASMSALREGLVISADKTILDFMVSAIDHPCQFVVGESGVQGLVTLSDLQRMPAQAALFALAIGIEGTLASLLVRVLGGASDAVIENSGLEDQDRTSIERYVAGDSYVSWPMALVFNRKIRLAEHLGLESDLVEQLHDWRGLRNALAHLDHYAGTREEAENRCRQVIASAALITALNDFRGATDVG